MNKALTVAIIGAGGRGNTFGRLIAQNPELGSVVGVAEPRQVARDAFAFQHGLKPEQSFSSWEALLQGPRRCDAVVISTLDRQHVAPAVAALEKGYHVLLEKPMATTLQDCRAIEAAQRNSGAFVAVCHSLRYHQGFSKVKDLLDSGAIGRLVTMDQIEQVAYWHQAHSFVRGAWRRQDETTFMLLAKSCHDLDYLAWLAGTPCVQVASAGSLTFFKKEFAPVGSAERCLDCRLEADCAFSAKKIYVDAKREEWPAAAASSDHSREAHLEAIRTGPFGRCVWRCDNDVVDHQVVMLEFAGGITGTFTMTGFTRDAGRKVRLHGTEGEIYFDEGAATIELKRFDRKGEQVIQLQEQEGEHGGGDLNVVRSWLQACRDGRPELIVTNAQESLSSHMIAFAAEKARLEGKTVMLSEMD